MSTDPSMRTVPVTVLVLALAALARAAAADDETTAAQERRWHLLAGVTLLGDSNIDHTREERADVGVIPAVGVEYRARSDNGRTELDYQVASHNYLETDNWDRISHALRAAYQFRSSRTWRPETILEVSIKGSNEDRDLANRYTLTQTLEYRMSSLQSITAYVSARRRDYELDEQDSWNPYAGIEFERKYPSGREWGVGYRYEENHAEARRRSYIRWTYELDYTEPLGRAGELDLEVKYRPRSYWRLIEVGGEDVTRRDTQWLAAAVWTCELGSSVTLSADYEFERRTSNDPDKGFTSHLLAVTILYRW